MASLHKFSLTLTLISSLLLIISFQSINAEGGDLITRICAGKLSYKRECINYLRSNKQVVAAAATNKSLDLALAIIKNLVIPQAKTTHNVLLKKKQASPGVYGVCEAEWAKAIPTFERILEVTTKNKGYKNGVKVDLIKEANTLSKCGFDLMGKKIVDREIMEGEGNVHVALGAANRLLSAASVHKDNDLITRYCATMLGSKQECINYFRSNKQVGAAAAKNKSLDLALAILKDLVIPQVNTTHDVLLKKKQATPKTYDFCEAEYAKVIPSLESILEVTTKNKGNKDEHRFDLIKKAIAKCSFDLNDKKVLDREFTEAEGNALIALGAANDLLSATSVHEDNDMITRYCATMLGSKQECINYFRSNEQVIAAAAKNKSLDLALAILKDLVIPQVKTTHDVLLKKKQATPETYDFCEAEYAKVIPSLESILEVTTKNKGNKDEHRFDLIKKAIRKCSFDLNGKKIADAKLTEAEGNALVALSAADNLLSGIYG